MFLLLPGICRIEFDALAEEPEETQNVNTVMVLPKADPKVVLEKSGQEKNVQLTANILDFNGKPIILKRETINPETLTTLDIAVWKKQLCRTKSRVTTNRTLSLRPMEPCGSELQHRKIITGMGPVKSKRTCVMKRCRLCEILRLMVVIILKISFREPIGSLLAGLLCIRKT